MVDEVRGKSDTQHANTVLSIFAPQYHYSILTHMRFEALLTRGKRDAEEYSRDLARQMKALEALGSKFNYMHLHQYAIRLWSSGRAGEWQTIRVSRKTLLMPDWEPYCIPPLIGCGENIALVFDYRLLLNPHRYYKFYKQVIPELLPLSRKEREFETINRGGRRFPTYGLMGLGPSGLFVGEDCGSCEDILRRHSERILNDNFNNYLIEAINNMLKSFSYKNNIYIYIYFPSNIEIKVFDNINNYLMNKIGQSMGVLAGGLQNLHNIINKYDIVVTFTSDPLPMLNGLDRTIFNDYADILKNKLILFFYEGLYFNIIHNYFNIIENMFYKILKSKATGRGSIKEEVSGLLWRVPFLPVISEGASEGLKQLSNNLELWEMIEFVKLFKELPPVYCGGSSRQKLVECEVLGPEIVLLNMKPLSELVKELPNIIATTPIRVRVASGKWRDIEHPSTTQLNGDKQNRSLNVALFHDISNLVREYCIRYRLEPEIRANRSRKVIERYYMGESYLTDMQMQRGLPRSSYKPAVFKVDDLRPKMD
ncbi:MAG: hypothetical protein LRS46_01470 [Desulfurococcales archaeon]|nr:hypothetical protein [Desulfurococcales archaeon]